MRRFLLSGFGILAALVLQLSVLDRLPLPGGVAPDLVLLVVVALALSNGPMAGLLTGFCAGLALDIAPPASHLIGLYALVLCLVGYCCGLVSARVENSVLLPLAASALGAAGGAALYAAAGVMLGNPDVSGQAVRHVLPLSVAYDVVASPFVLYAVALASGLIARLTGSVASPGDLSAAPGARSPARPAPGLTGRLVRPGWLARPDRSLRIPAAGPREGWITGGGWLAASAELARSRPATVRLHLSGRGQAGLLESARSAAGAPPATRTTPRLRFGSGRRRLGSGAGTSPASRATPRLRFGSGRRGLGSVWRGDGAVGGLFGRGLVTGGSAGLVGITGGGPGSRSWVSGGRSWVSGGRSRLSSSRSLGSGGTGGARGGSWASASGPRAQVHSSRSPRKGTFSGGSARPGAHGGGTLRPGTLSTPRRGWISGSSRPRTPPYGPSGGSPRKVHFSGGSARLTNFSGGSSGASSPHRGSAGASSPRPGTYGGSSRRRLLPGPSRRGSLARSPAPGGPRRGTFGSGRHDPFSHARVRHKGPKGHKSLPRGSLGSGSSSATWTGRLRTLFGLRPSRRLTRGRSGGKRTGGWP